MDKVYYFVIEDCGADGIGSHGHYDTIEEANKQLGNFQDLFPQYSYWVHPNDSPNEPVFVTL